MTNKKFREAWEEQIRDEIDLDQERIAEEFLGRTNKAIHFMFGFFAISIIMHFCNWFFFNHMDWEVIILMPLLFGAIFGVLFWLRRSQRAALIKVQTKIVMIS